VVIEIAGARLEVNQEVSHCWVRYDAQRHRIIVLPLGSADIHLDDSPAQAS